MEYQKLQKFQTTYNKIIWRQLQMRMIKKYLKKYFKKDIYLLKIGNKLFIIWDSYNGIIMECQKIINLLGNTPNQAPKFRANNWTEINEDTRGKYNTNSRI